MREFCKYGSVRGAAGNRRPYRESRTIAFARLFEDAILLDLTPFF